MACSSMAEHLTVNQGIGGSSPPMPATFLTKTETYCGNKQKLPQYEYLKTTKNKAP